MLPFQSNHKFGSISNPHGLVQEPKESTMKNETEGGDLMMMMMMSSSSEPWKRKKSSDASLQHAIAEQKRRKRINDHIRTLRQLLVPNITSKMVKALVLTEAVHQLRELKKRANVVAMRHDGVKCIGGTMGSCSFMFPSENDEAKVSYCEEGGEGKTVKAMVCCEDKPGLNRELMEAIRSVRGRVVRAEMATVGGRTKAEVVVEWRKGSGGEEEIGSLKRALKVVVDNRALGCSILSPAMSISGPIGLGQEAS